MTVAELAGLAPVGDVPALGFIDNSDESWLVVDCKVVAIGDEVLGAVRLQTRLRSAS